MSRLALIGRFGLTLGGLLAAFGDGADGSSGHRASRLIRAQQRRIDAPTSHSGGAGNDRLIGVNTAAGTFGLGETDLLTGGAAADVFVLGDGTRVFYDDQDPRATGEGDFATITDFRRAEDRIEPTGAPDFYRLDYFSPSPGRFDAALIHDTDAARGDLVAVLQDVPLGLALSEPDFWFL